MGASKKRNRKGTPGGKETIDAETCPPGSTSRERSGDRRLVSRINDCFPARVSKAEPSYPQVQPCIKGNSRTPQGVPQIGLAMAWASETHEPLKELDGVLWPHTRAGGPFLSAPRPSSSLSFSWIPRALVSPPGARERQGI